jgi:4-amino-4-deoxy-L-arabinose transferase-like glycosyltransferase
MTTVDEAGAEPGARQAPAAVRGRGAAAGRTRLEYGVLGAIAALAGFLYGWQAARAQFHGFYATAVRSITLSWRAFVFGALDPSASITIDKIPGFLWPQAASAWLFGFHPWALVLPQVVEGVVTVVVLGLAVRRWAGPSAGLLAAAGFALTPVAASLFGKALEDAALTCALVLAAGCWQRAVEGGRLGWLIGCAVFVGFAFQAKMVQAWAVLPAFGVAYLVAAPPRLRRRVAHVLAAGAVCLGVSLSWVALASFTPAADRPYIDGSTTNSAVAMVFGYNGLARFSQVGITAAGTGSVTAAQGAGMPGAGVAAGARGVDAAGAGLSGHGGGAAAQKAESTTHGGAAGTGAGAGSGVGQGAGAATSAAASSGNDWAKLVDPALASQVGWFYPAAAMGMLLGLVRRRRGRTDRIRAGTMMWTGWLLVTGLALSAGNVAHSTYVVALAPPLAALSAFAISQAVKAYRAPMLTRTARRGALLLPGLVAVTAAWALHLAWSFPKFAAVLTPPFAACATVVVALLVAAKFCVPGWSRPAAVGALASCAILFAQPAVWSFSVLDAKYAGSSGNANAGGYTGGFHFPARSTAVGGKSGTVLAEGAADGRTARTVALHGSAATMFNPFDPQPDLDSAQSRLLTFVQAHRDGAKYLLATQSWSVASPYIMDDAADVLPMGGFSGRADFPTPLQFRSWVRSGEIRYVLLASPWSGMPGQVPVHGAGASDSAGSATLARTASGLNRTAVPGSAAGTRAGVAAGSSSASAQGSAGSTDVQRIAAAVQRHCTLVPAASYGGVPQVTAPLYQCGEGSRPATRA